MKLDNKSIVYIALFAALTAAFGLFPPIPVGITGVPITVQSMAPMLAGAILGAKRGMLSQVLLAVLVAIGLPLLAGGRGGFGVFLGPTAGFIFGWIAAAYVIGYIVERFWKNLSIWHVIIACIIGSIIVGYALGIIWLAYNVNMTLTAALISCAPFIPGDLIKIVAAAIIAMVVKKSYPIIKQ